MNHPPLVSDRRVRADRRRRSDTALTAMLEGALAKGAVELLFQPQFSAGDNRLIGAEALVRWKTAEHGLLAGDALHRIAAGTGLSHRLSRHAWVRAIAQAARWPEGLRLSLNVTAADLASPDFPDSVAEAMGAANFAPERLTLEITEQALVRELDRSAAKLRQLVELGVAIALDDFGAGFCNFRYLKRLPLEALKLDRSMIEGIDACERDLAVLRAILAMARALGLKVIAEGIETETQRDAVAREGCAAWQGFLGGRPMRGDEFARLVQDDAARGG